eukprot:569718-Prymnesium_polylepis.1
MRLDEWLTFCRKEQMGEDEEESAIIAFRQAARLVKPLGGDVRPRMKSLSSHGSTFSSSRTSLAENFRFTTAAVQCA